MYWGVAIAAVDAHSTVTVMRIVVKLRRGLILSSLAPAVMKPAVAVKPVAKHRSTIREKVVCHSGR